MENDAKVEKFLVLCGNTMDASRFVSSLGGENPKQSTTMIRGYNDQPEITEDEDYEGDCDDDEEAEISEDLDEEECEEEPDSSDQTLTDNLSVLVKQEEPKGAVQKQRYSAWHIRPFKR